MKYLDVGVNKMKIISSTGGGGSSFVADQFQTNKWVVCLRPDGGRQKATHTVKQVFLERTRPYFYIDVEDGKYSQRELFQITYEKLNALRWPNLMLLCMSWGGMGYLNDLEEKTIFLLRDPIFAFTSYSGGGWRKEGGARRIKYIGATGPNDKKWIHVFLGDFSMWLDGAKNALKAYESGSGHIVRYHNFVEDWQKIDGVPPVHENFDSKDDYKKLEGFLTEETIDYIKEKTNDVWDKIKQI